MTFTISIVTLTILLITYKIYRVFSVPQELKDIPAISLSATLTSFFRREPFDVRFEKLIRPVLQKNGMARQWNQGRWELVISDPQQVKDIWAKPDKFSKTKENNTSVKGMLAVKILGTSNILRTDGDDWRRHRRVANPAFKKTWSTAMFGGCTDSLVDLIKASNGSPLQAHGLFQRLTLDVLGKGLFSYDFEAISKGEKNHYLRLYNDVMTAIKNPFYGIFPLLETLVPWRQADHKKTLEFRDFLRGIIRARKAELTDSHDDLLSLVTRAAVEEKEANLSEEDVINDLCVFFIAGHDTTAATLTTIFYYLCKHPEIQAKARQEVNRVLNGEKRVPTADELKELHYIDLIIKESMRIITIVPQMPRYCREKHTLSNGFTIPKDTFLNLQLWDIHHDAKMYPNPTEFNPDRFKDSHGPEANQWMAFGGGSRMCIGKNFSLMEQRVTLACLLQNFECTPGPNIAGQTSPTVSPNGVLSLVNVDVVFNPLT